MARSDIVFCCVSNSASVKEVSLYDTVSDCILKITEHVKVLAGTNGALSEMKRGKSFINMTTSEPKSSTELYQLVQMRGGRYLETPLIGSKKDASEGNFLLLAAGDYSLYEEALPCLELFSRRRSYVGQSVRAIMTRLRINA